MDILSAFNDQLRFITWFYRTAAQPFTALMREHTVRVLRQDSSDEFENQWREAHRAHEVLALCCLSLVSKAVLNYLLHFIMRELGASNPHAVSKLTKLEGRSTFEKYEKFLLENTTFRWNGWEEENSPVGRDKIEQMILCRNDFMHDDDIGSDQPKQRQSREDSRFIDPVSRAVRSAMETALSDLDGERIAELGELAKVPEKLPLTATREMSSVMDDARHFCAFIETKKTPR